MEFVDIPSTLWNQIAHAGQHDEAALNSLLERYRPPVFAFIRNMGANPEEAEDLMQEVFLRLVKDELLAKADRRRGRFRSFLLAVVRHTVQTRRRDERRLKRGGGVVLNSLERETDREKLEECLASDPERDQEFDSLWVQNLVRLALEQLKEECKERGTPYYQTLLEYTDPNGSYSEIARRMGASLQTVKNHLHQARTRLRSLVVEEIRRTTSSHSDFEIETAYLGRFVEP